MKVVIQKLNEQAFQSLRVRDKQLGTLCIAIEIPPSQKHICVYSYSKEFLTVESLKTE